MFSSSQQANVTKQWHDLESGVEELESQLRKKSRALTFRRGENEQRKELGRLLQLLEQQLSQVRTLRRTPQTWDATRPPTDERAREAWLEGIAMQLRRCGHDENVRGNAWQFAAQLARNLQDVRDLGSHVFQHSTFPRDEAALDDVDATVFRPYFAVSWDEITPTECPVETRETLQLATIAISNLRDVVREALSEKYGLRALSIVAKKTFFDVRSHETTPLLTLDCERAAQDNVIFAVERAGYEIRGEVLRRALVRRWQWTSTASDEDVEDTDDATESIEWQDVEPKSDNDTPNEDWRDVMKKGF